MSPSSVTESDSTAPRDSRLKRFSPALTALKSRAMNFSKRFIQNILRRAKRDSETSEASTMSEIKVAPEAASPPIEAVILPIAILPGVNSETSSPNQQMEPLPTEETTPFAITIDRPPSPQRVNGDEENDNEPPLLAPEVLIDPNLPSILIPPTERGTKDKGRSSPQSLRFELAKAPERTNPNYRRLSAVSSSSQWRMFPFGSLTSGTSPLLRPNLPDITPATTNEAQDNERTFEMDQKDKDADRFVGNWYGPGYSVPILLASEVSTETRPFIDDNVGCFNLFSYNSNASDSDPS